MDSPADEPRLTASSLLPLLAVVLVIGWCWAPMLRLPFTGEDYVLLERVGDGRPAWLHVFRPLPGLWLGGLHALFGVESPLPYHVGSLLLHLVNTVLVFLIAFELFRSRWSAALAAALFGISAGAVDSVAWISAVNRPWAGCGALLAYLGLVRLRRAPGLALALIVVGFLVGAFSNEEVYGTAPLVVGWLVVSAWQVPRLRKPALACAVLMAIEILAQFVFLQQVPGGSGGLLDRGLSGALSTIAIRAETMARGMGLDASLGVWIPLGGGLLLVASGNRRAAALGVLAWISALIPFALSTPSNYRGYPSLAPTALLLAGGVHAALALLTRGKALRFSLPVFALLLIALVRGANEVRMHRLVRWQAALHELSICARDARRLVQLDRVPPALINLELSSAGPFYYYYGISDPAGLAMLGFLDAASAYEEPGARPEGTWYGRRLDGSYGLIEPERYFARPVVEPLKLYGRAREVNDLDEARRALEDPALDLRREALVEGPVDATTLQDADDLGSIEILAPFEHDDRSGRMTVRIDAQAPALFAYQEHWLYEFLYRTSPDQAVITDTAEVRRVQMKATNRATGEALSVFPVNAFGFGFFVAPGVHEVDLAWSIRPAVKLR